ncbi:hypothetical protein CJ203_05495 [Corynebacterium tuscaniense]|uniref:Secreted protein n=1 Tax=Corynebacterium tuscaniense TaxID=302449 RepID=A0A2N6T562_9CORY|nr:hypothetical protein [Corynebacterium tuscaniense]KAA8746738.1 hypothetical protein F4V54_00350 [Corynebacterium tuscaniense]KGF24958.1 hypothetical protein HMPREF2129_00865 [Corynebacterium tuscaniense DNF00037]PMC64463.1 hypothetical protein CJ203_05495 [Corynebacterium tuscaniense]
MTLQPRPHNPIEARKQAVREHSRNAVISIGGGVVGGVVLGLIFPSFWLWFSLGLVVAVVGGVYNYVKVQQIINHQDEY